MKFSHKIIIAASSIILLTFCVSVLLSFQHASREYDQKLHDDTIENLESVSQAVTHWINGKINSINLLGEVIENEDLSPEAIVALMRRPLLEKEFMLIAGGLDADGTVMINLDSWDPGPGWDPRTRPWYKLARDHKKTMITSPYADAVTKEILISVGRPINHNGQFLGVFVGDVSLNALKDMMNAVSKNEDHYTFLFSESGMIVAHPDVNLNGKNISEIIRDGVLDTKKESVFQDVTVIDQKSKVMITSLGHLPTEDRWLLGVVHDKSQLEAKARELGIQAVFATLISVGLCVLVLSLVMNRLLKPLFSVSHSLQTIREKGDLTHRLKIESKDEFGKLSADVNQFLEYLQQMVRDIKDQALAIRSNSENMVKGSEQTSFRLDKQVIEIDNLANSMQEMTIAAENVAVSSQRTATAVMSAENDARAGLEKLSGVTESIGSLSDEMQTAVDAISRLSDVSAQIGNIVTTISGISDQTNLLALNASIEAARAGEAGRGFAVVADEVRSLASKTQQSTEEIDTMIRQLQAQTMQAQEAIENSRARTEEARSIANEADEKLSHIQESIGEINAMTTATAAAVEEQSAMAHLINDNTKNLRDISQNLQEMVANQVGVVEKTANLTHEQDRALNRFVA